MRDAAPGLLLCLLVACSAGPRSGRGELPTATVAPPVLPDECPGGTTRSRTDSGARPPGNAEDGEETASTRAGAVCTQSGSFIAVLAATASASSAPEPPAKPVKLPLDWESRAPTCAMIYQYQGPLACPPSAAACKPPVALPTPCNGHAAVAWNRIVEALPLRMRTDDGLRRAEAECALDVRALRRFCN
jgi:hypothetical protein